MFDIIQSNLASKINLSPQVASAAVNSKTSVLLLLIHCLLLLPMFVGVLCLVQYLVSFLVLHSSHLKWELVAWLWLSSWCLVAVSILCLFFVALWVGLQCVIVAFPGHTHFWHNISECIRMCTHMIVINTLTVIRKHCCLLMLSVKIFHVLYFNFNANNMDPDQTVPYGAVWSGAKLLVIEISTIQQQTKKQLTKVVIGRHGSTFILVLVYTVRQKCS